MSVTTMERLSQVDPVVVANDDDLLTPEEEVIEVPLLLSGWQMSALERAAHRSGQTTGEMVRQLLRDFLARSDGKLPAVSLEIGPA
jgi:hypothetical protein